MFVISPDGKVRDGLSAVPNAKSQKLGSSGLSVEMRIANSRIQLPSERRQRAESRKKAVSLGRPLLLA